MWFLLLLLAVGWAFLPVLPPADIVGQARMPAPTDPARENNIGVAYMFQGKYAEARQAFARAGNRVNGAIALLAQRRSEEAEKLFREVLAKDPHNIRAHYNLGLLYRSTGRLEEALKAFQGVAKLDPDDRDTQYYLGSVFFALRRYNEAKDHYQKVIEADPNFVSAYFGLGRSYVLLGEQQKGESYLKKFRQLTAGSKLNEPVGVQYGEQGIYSLAEENPPPKELALPAVPVKFTTLSAPFKPGGTGACFLDADGDGKPDLLLPGSGLYRNLGGEKFEVSEAAIPGVGCAAGDYDNDGATDFVVSLEKSARLYRNAGKGKFEKTAELPGGPGAIFLDFDHDGYLDLLAGTHLYRNKGNGTFEDVTSASKIAPADVRGMIATDYDNHRDIDFVMARRGADPVLYANNRDGSFRPLTPWPPGVASDAVTVVALDYNKDGWMDLFFTRAAGPPVLLENVQGKQFRQVALPIVGADPRVRPESSWGAAVLDYDNDGFLDLLYTGETGAHLLRNLGNGSFADMTFAVGLDRVKLKDPRAVITADIDDDGDTDVLITQAGGPPVLLRNDGGNRNGFLKVNARGLKDNGTGIGTKVEMRAGRLWQKVEIYGGAGFAQSDTQVIFGLGAHKAADFVRFLWPTGVLQDELPGAMARVSYQELDRKGGSCPILYAWDGTRFRFLSDVLGAGVVGEWVAPGVYNRPDPDEYLLAEGTVPQNGRYLFRLTNQMEEVIFFDSARLLVVDHPAEFEVLPNEGFTPEEPPRRFKLWQAWNLHPVRMAAQPVPPTAFMGFAAPHSLVLDLGDAARARNVQLYLYGWTEYFDSTSNYAAYHAGLRPQPPRLEVPDGKGGWRVALPSIGFPAGLPKWMVVDLTGALNATDPRVRISTNMEIYWLKAFAATSDRRGPMRATELRPSRAELRFLGYPKQLASRPESYDYRQVSATGPYAAHRGAYTRYGDVTELLAAADDRYVVMATGDEVSLEFDTRRLPPLPKGWKRTVIWGGEGFEKGMDFRHPAPLRVAPLPMHPGRRETPEIFAYRRRYNTRVLGGGPDDQPIYRTNWP